MNDTITLLLRHRSIRKFKPDSIAPQQLRAIIDSAQMASSSSNMQAYSVVGVTDSEKKKQIAGLAGNQKHIEEAPLLLVWCADLNRILVISKAYGIDHVESTTENFIIGTVDAALAAQNAAIAAESLGLGIVYIGGIRNKPTEVSALLKLPQLVYPVFGMCVGVPDQGPVLRPRLPLAAVYHEEVYSSELINQTVADYDDTIKRYMLERSGGRIDTNWSKQMAEKVSKPAREHMRAFLLAQGFEFK
jgi:FMN reductase (NADPH)